MLNRSETKISIAVIIFAAFVFRLLFVNTCILSHTTQVRSVLAKHVTSTPKKKYSTKATVETIVIDYTSGDVCEEDSDNEEVLKKVCSTAVSPILFSFHKRNALTTQSNHPFDLQCGSYPKKYLAISSLRI